MPRRSFQDQIGAAAYHEAGHAVMCHLMHLRIKSISIGADELYGGETTHENPFRATNRVSGDTIRTRLQVEKTIMLCLAGPLAQEKYAPRNPSRDYGGTIDFDTASTLAIQFFRSSKTAAAYISFAREWVRQRLDEPRIWAAVERLASALLEQQRISGRQAESIIRGRNAHLRGRSCRKLAEGIST
jgi:hypothetical protein